MKTGEEKENTVKIMINKIFLKLINCVGIDVFESSLLNKDSSSPIP